MKKLFICVFIILFGCIVDIRVGLILSCLIFGIFLFFFINKKMDTRIEHYTPTYLGQPKKSDDVHYKKIQPECMSLNCYKYNTDPFKVKDLVVEKNMIQKNNKLQGGQNPKTLLPPMMTRPMYDMNWRSSSMVVPNKINGETNEAIEKSGYIPMHSEEKSFSIIEPRKMRGTFDLHEEDIIENFDMDYNHASWDDSVLAANGYDAQQFETNKYPANLPRGPCGRQKVLEKHNESLFTTPIQPGVNFTTQVGQPINSNIGISFQQQLLPRTYSEEKGNLTITDHDPRFAPEPEIIEYPEMPKPENVYDPRFTGYGTSYRNYVDKVTGQPRFPYDDVNAVRMPNYIVRSKIDTHIFSDSYGPMQNHGLSLNDIRQKAQDVFLEDTTNFRNDMMSHLMRKRNSEMWQLKQYPHTQNGRRWAK